MSDSSYPTKIFPYLNPHIRKDYPDTTEAIDDWIKACLEDYPMLPDEFNYRDEFWRLSEWFDSWFDQFYDSSPTTISDKG